MSFVRAAEELSVTPAAISHQIKLLEHWVGVKLFERAARGVALSQAGQDYAASVRDVFDRLINASSAARVKRGRQVVHIRAQFSIATMFLLPHVLSFNHANADIEIHLSAINFDRNPSKGGADIAIYHRRPELEGYIQQDWVGGKYRVYGSPALLARHEVTTPAQLLSLPLLHTTSLLVPPMAPGLQDWFRVAGVSPPDTLPGMHFNLEHMTTAACVQGAGFALLLDALALDSARAGSLIALPGPTIDNPSPYTIMTKRHAKKEVMTVLQWLIRFARV